MKLRIIIVVLCIISYTKTAPACALASYCQACSTTNTSQCDLCYSWNTDAKAGASNAANFCTDVMPKTYKITNCLIYTDYAPTAVYTEMVAPSSGTTPRCQECDGQKFLEMEEATATQWCTDTLNTTFTKKVNDVLVSCETIANCKQTVC